jgi:hypothetical protein
MEIEFQRLAAGFGFPVAEIVDSGRENGRYFVIERSLGTTSLHDEALADAHRDGQISDHVIGTAAAISSRLLRAQASHRLPAAAWFEKAAFAAHVFGENPDLDTPRVHGAVMRALDRTSALPTVHGHLDYGLPNLLVNGVIDWQHHGPIPLGYDVYPALDIVAFKRGGKGYSVSPAQRTAYTNILDETTTDLIGQPVSEHLGDFMFVKCFFFLALMRPKPGQGTRPDKQRKWLYRRKLFRLGVDEYAKSRTIDTGLFPKLSEFEDTSGKPHP